MPGSTGFCPPPPLTHRPPSPPPLPPPLRAPPHLHLAKSQLQDWTGEKTMRGRGQKRNAHTRGGRELEQRNAHIGVGRRGGRETPTSPGGRRGGRETSNSPDLGGLAEKHHHNQIWKTWHRSIHHHHRFWRLGRETPSSPYFLRLGRETPSSPDLEVLA